ncbi:MULTISPECIES: metallophosphoesterase [unclassified Pannonibacter]|uniref:metallophosphoesterase n=1 Tax=unclassified Pannonibacter TaxID=2627228 RepID=UPI001647CFE9|nr:MULTISPECIES: metallophosphoesterase [unclassified Pannonibacter]
MRIHVLSDLHREHPFDFPKLPVELGEIDADFIVMAGDINNAFRLSLPHEVHEKTGLPVIHISGNHELYNRDRVPVSEIHEELRRRAGGSDGVWFLENDFIDLPARNGGLVRFIGATLWTDWNFFQQPDVSMKAARIGMSDYRHIWVTGDDGRPRLLTPDDTLLWHQESRSFIESILAEPFDGRTVVVTHHAANEVGMRNPWELEKHSRGLQPAYGSDLSAIMEADNAPDFWISGHTHISCDVEHGNTRIISNAQGYFDPQLKRPENREFNAGLIVNLGDCPRMKRQEFVP